MDARLAILLVLFLAAAASSPLASAQLDREFYKTSCPDAEKVIFDIVQKRFKADPGTAAGLLRLVFHDCFANGCDASILIDPLSNQASEKEAGPNVSVRGYDVIEEIKTELEKKCPNVVSCADIVTTSARDAVRLTGGPAYEVPMGRRDSLTSNREDADNLPGPDIAVPKLIDEFSKQGFSLEEMVVMLAGGHSIGICRCFFIETDAAPIDPEFKKNITSACDGKDSGNVPMDFVSPNTFDSSYFGLALAKKMPLTIDRLLGMDAKTEPVLKSMEAKPTDFVPLFAKAMEKLSVLKVLTGKEGEIRKTCSEFNTAAPSGGASVIRVSSLNPEEQLLGGLPQPGGRKAGGPVDPAVSVPLSPSELEAKRLKNEGKIANTNADEAAAKVLGGVVVSDRGVIQPPKVVPLIGEESKMAAPGDKIQAGDEPGSKLPGPEGVKPPGPKLRGAAQ
ncbi:peroxidase 44-like [Panicum virgatum]|uniref:peroxidase n=1 Tax=Panicum virgatum TaxID=38727 RepID=A0A8T0N1W8_PANVG|nr:peroxidase 44-like [Panicum virgatum]KAG2543420.1 hypothetical protein PVAP13_9NG744400 [Panicum virgatum]